VPSAAKRPKPCLKRQKFGRNLARLRVAASLTQEKLAERVGLSARYIQSVEAGDNWPSLPKLGRMRAALDCQWNELLAGC